MHHTTRRRAKKPSSALPIDIGDYVCSERELFRIEDLGRERGLVEDCRTGNLLYMPISQLLELRRVA